MLTHGIIQIVITLRSKVVETAFRLMDSTDRVTLRSGLELQVLPSLRDIKLAQRHQCAAFIHDESYILVWDDSPTKLLERAADLEHQLVDIAGDGFMVRVLRCVASDLGRDLQDLLEAFALVEALGEAESRPGDPGQ